MKSITSYELKSNGKFSIVNHSYYKKQHSNQQNGIDMYVDVLDHSTGIVNSVKLYENTKGIHFKKGGNHYLPEFVLDYIYIPLQIYAKVNP